MPSSVPIRIIEASASWIAGPGPARRSRRARAGCLDTLTSCPPPDKGRPGPPAPPSASAGGQFHPGRFLGPPRAEGFLEARLDPRDLGLTVEVPLFVGVLDHVVELGLRP